MKCNSIIRLFFAGAFALGLSLTAGAADEQKDKDNKEKGKEHAHEHAAKTGPTHGKLLTEVEPHVEFLVTKDKKIEIRFVDDNNKVVAPGTQEITVVLGDRAAPTKLTFTKDGDKLVSDKVVPEGKDLPTVVQIREKAGAKAVNVKFALNLEKCPTCSNQEYNCTCAHGDDHDHEGHDH